MKPSYYLGLDIGSVSVNAVVMCPDEQSVRHEEYIRTYGRPLETARSAIERLRSRLPEGSLAGVAVTGSGGPMVGGELDCYCVNEVIAQALATATIQPAIRSIIEIGGQDAKLIILENRYGLERKNIRSFSMNTVCAAGTGSFLDQQAARLGIKIEGEFGRLALTSQHPPRIAGRCSVFAKSDMIHLQQIATPDRDILMGLCLAMARNFKSTILKGSALELPVSFQGGVAANQGMVRAFESVLGLSPGELIVPVHFSSMGAIGAVLAMRDDECLPTHSFSSTVTAARQTDEEKYAKILPPLKPGAYRLCVETEALPPTGQPIDAFLGVDVGSISTNLVVIDGAGRVLSRRYLMTSGKPIEAVRRGLLEIGRETGGRVFIQGAATTGSGRYLIGDIIGADCVKNEITAHARGAVHINPDVDTIFEIGGQDSKYISLDNGVVTDFTMNKACAAGTGSFLEEQSEKLGLSIKADFCPAAERSRSPADLGERCTVFMESSLNTLLQQGASKEDLAAGLCYSIAHNYLNRVVEDRKIGNVIFFQGGTAYNSGVKKAFENICGKKVTVPPHHDVLGAVGAALIARDNRPRNGTCFKGFDVAQRSYSVETVSCTDCPNACEISRVCVEGSRPLHYGSRCGKYDEERKEAPGSDLPRLFARREKTLGAATSARKRSSSERPIVGIPRTALYFDLYPYWHAFFSELGFRTVLSRPTNRETISKGCETALEDTCFPVKAAHGHVVELLGQGVEFLFLPSVINMGVQMPPGYSSYVCPYVQSLPSLVRAAVDIEAHGTTLLAPVLHPAWGSRFLDVPLRRLARTALGSSDNTISRALKAASAAEGAFAENLNHVGREALSNLSSKNINLVVVSRPYNSCDPGINFHVPDKLRELGAVAVPLDFLPRTNNGVPSADKTMYWHYGRRILAAARFIAANPHLHALYISNFGCGPDSFIAKYFHRIMKGKPYLFLELDEHSADAGIVTRLEAFLDSLKTSRPSIPAKKHTARNPRPSIRPAVSRNGYTVYIPYMDDHGIVLAAAMKRNGIRAEVLPASDEESLKLGRRYTSGRECYPCILTTGDIVKKALAEQFQPDRSCFFMPSAMGPCRFGQYAGFHRMVLDDLNLSSVSLLVLDQTSNLPVDSRLFGRDFRAAAWQGILFVDYLKKILHSTRPYELSAGACDDAYADCLNVLSKTIQQGKALTTCAAYARRRFSSVAVDRSCRKPLIGIIGEIYVRSNPFSNNFLIRQIEALGGEVVTPTIQEWIQYTDVQRRKDLLRDRAFRRYVSELLSLQVQRYYSNSLSRCFRGSVRCFEKELSTQKVLSLCSPYLTEAVRGEAVLSLGRSVEYGRHGVQAIAHLIPFNCLPGTIVNTLLCSFSRDYDLPVLKMVYDGTPQSSDQIKIDAFMYQARQAGRNNHEKRGGSSRG